MNKKYLFPLLLFIVSFNSFCLAQVTPTIGFNIPDTVCVNSPVTITNTTSGASSYYWNFCNGSSNKTPIGTNIGNLGNSLNIPVFMDYGYENGNYYGFIINHQGAGTVLTRLNFGNSLLNTPTTTILGSFGGVLSTTPEGVQLINNKGLWVLIVVGGDPNQGDPSTVMKFDFGTSLTNLNPIPTNWGNIGSLDYPTDLYVFNDNGNWYGLTVNIWGNTITSFNFGTNFNSTPIGTNLGNIGNLNNPNGMFPINDNGIWRLFIANRGSSSISRVDFGNSLKNIPNYGINLGNPNNVLNGSTDIIIFNTCNQTTGYVLNVFANEIIQLNFNNITSTPTGTSLGNIGNFNLPDGFSKIFRIGSDLYTFITNANPNGSSLTRIKFPGCNNSSIPSSTLQNPPSILSLIHI